MLLATYRYVVACITDNRVDMNALQYGAICTCLARLPRQSTDTTVCTHRLTACGLGSAFGPDPHALAHQ